MSAWRRRLAAAAGFALLALLTELTGRSIVVRLDRAFHVVPLATPTRRTTRSCSRASGRSAPCSSPGWRAPRQGAHHRRRRPAPAWRRRAPVAPAAAPAAQAVAAAVAPLLRRHLDLVPAPERRRARRARALGAARAVAPHLRAGRLRSALRAARDRLGSDPPVARRGRRLRRSHVRARVPHPARRPGPPAPSTARRRTGSSSALRPRVRVPAAATRRLARGATPCPRAAVSFDVRRRCGGITSCHSPIGDLCLQRSACPCRIADRAARRRRRHRLGDPAAVPDHALAPARPGLLVARDRAAPARHGGGRLFALVSRARSSPTSRAPWSPVARWSLAVRGRDPPRSG